VRRFLSTNTVSRPRRSGLLLLTGSLAIAAAAAACSTDDAPAAGEGCLTTRAYFEQSVWSAFMAQKCGKCHTPDGVAVSEQNAKFVLQPSSYPGFVDANLANIAELAKVQYEGKSELLQKPLGLMNHGGGAQIAADGPEMQALTELLNRIGAPDACAETVNAALASVTLTDAPNTLRRAGLDLVGRLPTEAELTSLSTGGDAALDAALDGMMKEDAFYERLREIWNDVLLTDRFLSYGGAAIDSMNGTDYPGLAPYKDPNNPAYQNPIRPIINRAIAREPLDLITYIVRNGKPFTEVVAADYTVVNPFSAIAYGVNTKFADPMDENELHEAKIKLAGSVDIPHAGVLSAPMFLNRWPTTPTNRNRARARRVEQFFLATDVLKIAERPVDPSKLTAEDNPSRNSPLCTVCHKVIDPIAGAFRGYDDYDYEHFDPSKMWHDDMFLPGFGGEDMDPTFYTHALQWLGPQLAADPRFGIAAVRTVFEGLTGRKPIVYPRDASDPAFQAKLSAWQTQDNFFRTAADGLAAANFDLKVAFKSVIKSPYYRAIGAAEGADPNLLEALGLGKLLTPELLNRKIAAVTGVRWRKRWDWENEHDWLNEDYKILYGGIDSNAVITRLTNPNGLTVNIAARMANELSCMATAWDFTRAAEERTLFPKVTLDEVPESAGHPVDLSIADIKANIAYLHERLLGEKLAIDDPEIERTYQVFLETWRELEKTGKADLNWNCAGRWSALDGKDLPEADQITSDPNYTVRSWMAVTAYLLNDYKFLYQ